jgi:acyl carrier protein
MNNDATLSQLRTLVVDKFDVKPEDLADDRHFSELGMDSLGMADFVFQLEDIFGVVIEYEQAMVDPTLGGCARLIDGLKANKAVQATEVSVA